MIAIQFIITQVFIINKPKSNTYILSKYF